MIKTDRATKVIYYILLISSTLAILLFCFSEGISGNDFWWHIKTGEWICRNHAVPNKDMFSWYGTAHDFQWTMQEWLSQVFYWKLYHNCGEGGVFLFCLSAAALMLFLLFVRVRRGLTDNVLVTSFYVCLFGVLASVFFYGRPHVFSFFLLYWELYCLYEFAEGTKKWCIWMIPVIACLWSNLHGGSSSLSYLLVGVFLLCGIRNWQIGRIVSMAWSKIQFLQVASILVLTVTAVCLNPSGYRILVYPYVNMMDKVALQAVSEWAAPDAKNIEQVILYFLPVFLLCMGMLFGEGQIKLWDVALMLLFLFLFFRSIRFGILFYLSAAFWAMPYYLPCRLQNIRKRWEMLLLGVVEILLVAVMVISVRRNILFWQQGNLISEVLEDQAIEIVREDMPERLFNDYNYGESLIFHDIPVFVDARSDIYTQDHILEDTISLLFLQQANQESDTKSVDVEALIEHYGFDGILISTSRPLYSYLISHEERYEPVFVSAETAYFRLR